MSCGSLRSSELQQYSSAFLAVGPREWNSATGSPGKYPIAVSDTGNSAVAIGENTLSTESDVSIALVNFAQTPLYSSSLVRVARPLVHAGFPLQPFLERHRDLPDDASQQAGETVNP